MTALLVLLAGIFIFGVFGYLDTTLDTAAICEDGVLVCYIPEEAAASVSSGTTIRVGDREYAVTDRSAFPILIDETMDAFAMHLSKLSVGQWVYRVTANTDLENGTYKAQITTERVSPISLILN